MTLLMGAPISTVLLLQPATHSLEQVALLARVVACVVLIAGALVLYLYWRLECTTALAWVTATAVFASSQALASTALEYTRRDEAGALPGWMGLNNLAVTAVTAAMIVASRRAARAPDPLMLGLSVGMLAIAVRLVTIAEATPLGAATSDLVTITLLLLVVSLTIVALLVRHPGLPARVWRPLAWVALLLGAGQVGDSPALPGVWPGVVAAAALVLAALVLALTTSGLLRRALADQLALTHSLDDRLVEIAQAVRSDKERMHEIRSTVAGISSASQLISDYPLAEPARRRLERTVCSETSRLSRLLEAEAPGGSVVVDLDATLDPLMQTHRARGHRVEWEPTGARVSGRPDDVAEVVNILLENAATHGGNTASHVAVTIEDDAVAITVNDNGPGVPAEAREQIFDWGVRGSSSPGQGIGLNLARRLVAEQGGSLTLAERQGAGSSFVVRLPAVHRPAETNAVPRV